MWWSRTISHGVARSADHGSMGPRWRSFGCEPVASVLRNVVRKTKSLLEHPRTVLAATLARTLVGRMDVKRLLRFCCGEIGLFANFANGFCAAPHTLPEVLLAPAGEAMAEDRERQRRRRRDVGDAVMMLGNGGKQAWPCRAAATRYLTTLP